jgi:uncharacterized oxidoreductase
MQMTGNTIFITGGTSGIGRALAEAFHALGSKVIIAGRRKALLDAVAAANPGIEGVALNIDDAEDISRVAAEVTAKYPGLNVLINNAGIMPFDDAAGAIDGAVSEAILRTNLLGPIALTSALIGHLKAQPRATVIYNTSALAYVPLASAAVYSASKAGLHSYALSQRFALRDTNVTVQEIAPPWVATDLVPAQGDPRAMPLAAFIAETMALLATEAPEICVEGMRVLRANPGPDEHRFVHDFNLSLSAAPLAS